MLIDINLDICSLPLSLPGPVVQRQNGPSSEESEAQRRYEFPQPALLKTRAERKKNTNIKNMKITNVDEDKCMKCFTGNRFGKPS